MTVNIAIALFYALRAAVKEASSVAGKFKNPATEKITQELLQVRLPILSGVMPRTNNDLEFHKRSRSRCSLHWF